MVERDRRDVEAVDVELDAGLDLVELEHRRHRLERHREELVARDAADHLVQQGTIDVLEVPLEDVIEVAHRLVKVDAEDESERVQG